MLLLPVLALAGVAAAAKLPPNIKRCARTDPNVDECLRAAVEDALPKLKGGLPKLGVHPLDPLIISEMQLSQGRDGPVNMHLTFTNMTTTKILDGVKVLRVRYDYDKQIMEAESVTPYVLVVSNYTVKGNVLLLPITGTGPNTVQLYDITTKLVLKGKKITKADGKEYFEVTDVIAKLTPKKMVLRMENLFNGDKQLGETMNRVLNDNWELLYQEIGPSLEDAYAELFKRPARALFLHVPLDEVLPNSL